jgi:hypothetical protein
MRQTVDLVDPAMLRKPFKAIFNELQRGKALEGFDFYRGSYLLAIDGTGFFSSNEVHCENCCVKNHRDGTQTYYHQMLGAALVHPDQKLVIPFAPEPIQKQDGEKKNDCERNAVKRQLCAIRDEHPRLDITVTEDALSANFPHIQDLRSCGMHFILGIKPGDHKNFFERLEEDALAGLTTSHIVRDGAIIREYLFINGILLKENEPDSKVSYFEVIETDEKGKKTKFSWVTDFLITKSNIEKLMKGGRARWRIENEVFNTLKNQGYQFEHNFGHGRKNLSTNLAMLMMLAFLIDQASELCCRLFQRARQEAKTLRSMWEKMRVLFWTIELESWEVLFGIISRDIKVKLVHDTG